MTHQARNRTVRRSVALPRDLVDEALECAPDNLRGNFNQVVATAVRAWVARRRRERFAEEMAEMAADPEIRKECLAIASEFEGTEMDGLEDTR